LNGEADGSYTGAKLTGIAVGNGCSGTEVGICGSGPQGTYYEWDYLIQTSFVSKELKEQVNAACDWAAAAKNVPNALSVQCVNLLNQASGQIQNVNLYDIYGDCVNDMCAAADNKPRGKVPMRESYVATEGGESRRLARIIPQGPDACIDSGTASGYLNQPEVMAAIHVKDPGFCWAVCNTAPTWSYQSTRTNLPANTYPFLVKNIQVTVYNGDWDACVPYTDGYAWTESLGLPVKSAWHAWKFTSPDGAADQVAGYATVYDTGVTTGTFAFVTIKGGRHEVPISAPGQALEMLSRVVNGETF
jgi:Serine carboxypeptidase